MIQQDLKCMTSLPWLINTVNNIVDNFVNNNVNNKEMIQALKCMTSLPWSMAHQLKARHQPLRVSLITKICTAKVELESLWYYQRFLKIQVRQSLILNPVYILDLQYLQWRKDHQVNCDKDQIRFVLQILRARLDKTDLVLDIFLDWQGGLWRKRSSQNWVFSSVRSSYSDDVLV